MLLQNINPCVRFAGPVTFREVRRPSRTYDCRLLYTVSGAGSATLDGRKIPLSHGVLFLFQPGVCYTITPEDTLSFLVVDFDYTQEYSHATDFFLPCPEGEFSFAAAHKPIRFEDAPRLNDPFVINDAYGAESALTELAAEFRFRKPFHREVCSSILARLLCELLRSTALSDKNPDLTERVTKYIAAHYAEPISNDTIARALNYNPSYLNRRMVASTGRSLHRNLLDYRLAVAIQLLLNTERSISEIAAEVGFGSLSHFSNIFRQYTGVFPMQYRKKQTP